MPRAKKIDPEVVTVNEQTQNPAEEPENTSAENGAVPMEAETAAEPETKPADTGDESIPAAEPPKKKRAAKKKEPDKPAESLLVSEPPAEIKESLPASEMPADPPVKPPPKTAKRTAEKIKDPPVLTISSGDEVETPEEREEIIWHEIRNAYRTRKILTGTLGGIERAENGNIIAVVYHKDLRIVIPLSEMMISIAEGQNFRGDLLTRQTKILGNSLGAEIDFVIKGIDAKTRSVVASRKDAMLKKRKLFYFDTDASGQYRIYEGRIVQARVIAVAQKAVRIEVFGVECGIQARDLTYDWMGDAHERFHVGDQILVRILEVKRDSIEDLRIRADVKSIAGNSGRENLKKCRVQGKYAGKVTDVHKGVIFIRLNIGVNAIAHSCYDNKLPGKKDDVSFAVTHIDEEQNVAVGIITRVIRQNL
ncbi:MAG: S1 RNA-binding domain-containing protein [Oscillospiraceae bacterium]|jgi:ribosomal protein S1|nr:S1 RNA-binding domain-containing protein [Oscillospiraceae bacterium]